MNERDTTFELTEPVPGGRIEMFAIEDDDSPGGWFYRFQYYHPDVGPLLRYDDSHLIEGLGWHHRHVAGLDAQAMPYQNIVSHIALFIRELACVIDEALTT